MTEEMKREKLQEIIDNLDETDVIEMWNEACPSDRDIHYMDELDEHFKHASPTNIVDSLVDGFSTSDYYFAEGDYGDLESFDDIYDVVDDCIIIDYMLDMDEDFGNDDIRNILDEELTDEEEGE